MNFLQPKHAVKILFILCALCFPSLGAISITVSPTNDLTKISTDLPGVPDKGLYNINFSTYTNVGKFKLEATQADTLVFSRSSDSEAAIDVQGTLFDFKQISATIIIHNLAFHLLGPNSILISGADANRKNKNLVLDSCYIFAEQLNSIFLSWIADDNSSIIFKHCFLVSKTGKDTMSLEAGTIAMSNNNINFAGYITTKSHADLKLVNNTFNRTQLACDGALYTSNYTITDNLFATHSKLNALVIGGDTAYYPMSLVAFSEASPLVLRNKRYSTWAGFVPPPGIQFSQASNVVIAPYAGRDSSTLWNWYIPGESAAGFPNGPGKSPIAFNVFPGDTMMADTLDQTTPAKFYFRPSSIPRNADAQFLGNRLDSTIGANLRPVWPDRGGIKLGVATSFQVDSIIIPNIPTYSGSPVLMSFVNGKFQEPAPGPSAAGAQWRFENKYPGAVSFHPAYFCSTPRGLGSVPTNTATGKDTLRFEQVDSAGYTAFLEPTPLPTFKKNYRYLNTRLNFQTSAKIAAKTMEFGSALATSPYIASKVSWWLNGADTLLTPKVVNGKYMTTVKAANTLDAYLIEQLSVPRGNQTFPVTGGSVQTVSPNGFQMSIDSSFVANPVLFGTVTKGYRVTWAGRSDSDTVSIVLKTTQGQEAFRDSAGVAVKVAWAPDSAGSSRVKVGVGDSGKSFFFAVKYNVLQNIAFNDTVDGVIVHNLLSSVSGRLGFQSLGSGALDSPLVGGDTLFKNAHWLAGRAVNAIGLKVAGNWDINFAAPGALDRSKAEAYASDGVKWIKLASPVYPSADFPGINITGVPGNAQIVIVVERLNSPDSYIDQQTKIEGGKFLLSAKYKDTLNTQITDYALVIKGIDVLGAIDTIISKPHKISDTIMIVPPSNELLVYKVQYYTGTQEYGHPQYLPAPEFKWDPKLLRPQPSKENVEDRWHMLGFSCTGLFSKIMKKEFLQRGDSIADVRSVFRLTKINGNVKFDSIPNPDTLSVAPGQAYLFGASMPHQMDLDTQETFLPLAPYSLPAAADSGWQLISSPFPVTTAFGKIRSTEPGTLNFRQLDVTLPQGAAGKGIYHWNPAATLRACQGYAYYFKKGEVLTFDPLYDTSASAAFKAAAKSSASVAGVTPVLLNARLTSGPDFSEMSFTTSRSERNLPFLPAPGASLEMRVGGAGGFMQKVVGDARGIDEPIDIQSDRDRSAAFSLRLADAPAQSGYQIKLIDLATGNLLEGAALQELPLVKGAQSYRLIAGDENFVSQRLQGFFAGAPKFMELSQNFPNPVRHLTRIRLEWPAVTSRDRKANLDVVDLRGKRVASLALTNIEVGEQIITLDASKWTPGIYLYRLSVVTDGAETHLQKRMLVVP